MAAKKKSVVEETVVVPLNERVMKVMLDQVCDGNGPIGMTFAEIREALRLNQGDDGFAEVVGVMSQLRDNNILAHKFNHPTLKDNFFQGDPTDIPNIQKRENSARIKQLVFFVHPFAMMMDDSLLMKSLDTTIANVSGAGAEFPMNMIFTRESIGNWFEGLAETLDIYVSDPAENALSGAMITALKPY